MRFDLSKDGLETLFLPWQVAIIEEMFRRKESDVKRKDWRGREATDNTSRDIYDFLRGKHDISRASVINFLELLVEENILIRDEESCKGGSRGLYSLRYGRREFEEDMAWRIGKKLAETFPETQSARNWRSMQTYAKSP